mgnify:CR=1 FL=1
MHGSQADTASALAPVDRERLLTALRSAAPGLDLIVEAESQRPYECDALSLYRQLPLLTALPATVDQVQAVLRVCNSLAVPAVARGAGTGLCAGAMPHPEGVLLVLSKLDRILAIDADARSARVQPGVANLAISRAAAAHGLYYAPDPSSQIACTIGGNVAENSGGVHCLKYGLTTHNLLALTVLTVEGDMITLGGSGLDGPGLDLMALLTGSEGLLGVVVEITVKLLPQPELARVILAGFASVRAAGEAVGAIIAAGIIPAGLEMMDSMVPGKRWRRRSCRCRPCCNSRAPPPCGCPATSGNGRCCGPGASRPSPRWGGWHRTTTAWTVPYPAARWPRYWRKSAAWHRAMGSRWPMSSTPATATCTR